MDKKLLQSNGSEDREALLLDWLFGLNFLQLFDDFAFIIGELCWDLDPDVDLHNQCMSQAAPETGYAVWTLLKRQGQTISDPVLLLTLSSVVEIPKSTDLKHGAGLLRSTNQKGMTD